jgi:hypothetical protein
MRYNVILSNTREIEMAQGTKRFIVNEKGQKTGILLSLKEYRTLLEDLQDLAVIAERKDEPSEPFNVVKENLLNKWNTESK